MGNRGPVLGRAAISSLSDASGSVSGSGSSGGGAMSSLSSPNATVERLGDLYAGGGEGRVAMEELVTCNRLGGVRGGLSFSLPLILDEPEYGAGECVRLGGRLPCAPRNGEVGNGARIA